MAQPTNLSGTIQTGQFGTAGSTASGIEEVISSGAEVSYKTVVPVKDGQGKVKSILKGRAQADLQASGYVSAYTTPDLGGAISVGGLSGKITSASLQASDEDMVKASVQGEGVDS